jgi:energy-converting hydrogenase Eha subunit F
MLIFNIFIGQGTNLNRIILILRNRVAAILFIIAAAAGAVLIFWYLNNTRQDNSADESREQDYKIIEENAMMEMDFKNHDVYQGRLSARIPPGKKAVNLPVTFFGDCSILATDDRIDIISIYYDKESDTLDSEIILSGKEIINFETDQYRSEAISESMGGLILSEDYYRSGIDSNIKNILVITFYLDNEEVVRSFKALESGVLYLSLCSGQGIGSIY